MRMTVCTRQSFLLPGDEAMGIDDINYAQRPNKVYGDSRDLGTVINL